MEDTVSLSIYVAGTSTVPNHRNPKTAISQPPIGEETRRRIGNFSKIVLFPYIIRPIATKHYIERGRDRVRSTIAH